MWSAKRSPPETSLITAVWDYVSSQRVYSRGWNIVTPPDKLLSRRTVSEGAYLVFKHGSIHPTDCPRNFVEPIHHQHRRVHVSLNRMDISRQNARARMPKNRRDREAVNASRSKPGRCRVSQVVENERQPDRIANQIVSSVQLLDMLSRKAPGRESPF